MSEWVEKRMDEIAEFNPRESIKKGSIAKKISMDKLLPFCRDILEYEMDSFSGGSKFRNNDTIMARITPCLENGKTALVNILEENEVGFGSTEYIVFRAKKGYDPDFIYYLVTSPLVREPAIKSMVGTSGRQRVQIDVVQGLKIKVPNYSEQKSISGIMKLLDDRIAINRTINNNLQEQAFVMFDRLMSTHKGDDLCELSEIAEINPRRSIPKNKYARCVDMSRLSTTGAFPDGWDSKPYTGGVKFTNGDTIMARITPCLENGKNAFINFLDKDEIAYGSTEYIVLAPKKDVPAELLYCLVRYKPFAEYAKKNMNGTSGRQRVSGDSIGQYLIPCFSAEEMNSFGIFARATFEAMQKNWMESLKLAAMRDTLLPKLITGELSVSDVELE